MAGNSKRNIIQLESTVGTGYRYTVTKSRKLHPERIEFKKYDPIVRKHVVFKVLALPGRPIHGGATALAVRFTAR